MPILYIYIYVRVGPNWPVNYSHIHDYNGQRRPERRYKAAGYIKVPAIFSIGLYEIPPEAGQQGGQLNQAGISHFHNIGTIASSTLGRAKQ